MLETYSSTVMLIFLYFNDTLTEIYEIYQVCVHLCPTPAYVYGCIYIYRNICLIIFFAYLSFSE